MIVLEEIRKNEVIKVLLLNEEDIEEEVYAVVEDNRGDHLEIKYLEETERIYKDALIYSVSEDIEVIRPESVLEHYPEVYNFENIDELKKVGDNMYVFIDEIDIEDDDSVINTIEDDSSYTEDSFLVADDVIDGEIQRPPSANRIDEEWKEWEPRSPGAKRYKETIDIIEYYAKQQADKNNFAL